MLASKSLGLGWIFGFGVNTQGSVLKLTDNAVKLSKRQR